MVEWARIPAEECSWLARFANSGRVGEDSISGSQFSCIYIISAGNLETVTRYGSKLELLRITSLVLKFIALLKSKNDDQSWELHGDELMAAQDKWVMSIQKQVFSKEYHQLLCVMYVKGNLVWPSMRRS